MTPTQLPDLLHRGTAIFLFALGIGLVTAHTVLVARAAQHVALGRWRRALVPGLVAAFLAVWLGVAMTIGDRTSFPLGGEDRRLFASALVGFGPMCLAIALLFASRTLRRVNAAMPPAWLIWVQTYRVVGLIFLYPFLYYGLVPAGFAVPAGVGDLLTSGLAPLVGLAVARRRPHAIAWAAAWNLFGLLDLIVVPAAAVILQAQVLELYPLSLVPLFIGPPLGILTHMYSLRNLAAVARGNGEDVRRVSAVEHGTGTLGVALRT